MFNKFAALLILTVSIAQAVDIPRPVFSKERIFVMQESQAAQVLRFSSGIQGYVFQEGLNECGISQDEMELQLSRIFKDGESSVFDTIRRFIPKLNVQKFKGLRLLVDYFGVAARNYRSFYLPAQNENPPMISLDCQPGSRQAWPALVGHELVHHFNQGQHLSVWMDEMLAQLVEVENFSSESHPRIQNLSNSALVPAFFTNGPVFQSSEQYAANLLFGLYLKKLMGPSVFKTLTSSIQNLNDLSLRLQAYAQNREELQWLKSSLTPAGLIRHFHLALSVNLPILNKGSIYQVPQWNGFSTKAVWEKGLVSLTPGSSIRVLNEVRFQELEWPKGLEAYRILKNSVQFKILKPKDKTDETGWATSDVLVIINTTENQTFEIEI